MDYTSQTPRALVRCAYSQDAVWREALGDSAKLFCFVTLECGIDAPQRIPYGGSKSGHDIATV
jgi:hypothetical protein